jgi:hypothetical protein
VQKEMVLAVSQQQCSEPPSCKQMQNHRAQCILQSQQESGYSIPCAWHLK